MHVPLDTKSHRLVFLEPTNSPEGSRGGSTGNLQAFTSVDRQSPLNLTRQVVADDPEDTRLSVSVASVSTPEPEDQLEARCGT